VPANFLPLTEDAIERVLPFMARLYSQDALAFDAARARRLCRWLLANPDCGAVWLIESAGVEVGYVAITICVSLEFHGRFALLDELYLDDAGRGRGIGGEAIAFAADWARQRGLAALRLEVAGENAHALHVYRKSGFVLHDRHIMTKWL
jgi:GNAT superfamily N-acetyltransferase